MNILSDLLMKALLKLQRHEYEYAFATPDNIIFYGCDVCSGDCSDACEGDCAGQCEGDCIGLCETNCEGWCEGWGENEFV